VDPILDRAISGARVDISEPRHLPANRLQGSDRGFGALEEGPCLESTSIVAVDISAQRDPHRLIRFEVSTESGVVPVESLVNRVGIGGHGFPDT